MLKRSDFDKNWYNASLWDALLDERKEFEVFDFGLVQDSWNLVFGVSIGDNKSESPAKFTKLIP